MGLGGGGRGGGLLLGKGVTYTNGNGTTFAALFGWQRVRLTEVGTPVASSNRQDRQLGDDDGGADGGCDFLRGLNAETDVTF